MRLFLLPISTRRTLIYCKRLNVLTTKDQGWIDKGTTRAAALWQSWEKKESGWQKRVVQYGNQALKRIPYEEWGLKSIPALSARRKSDELSGNEKVEVLFPSHLIPESQVTEVLRKLGTERQQLHRSRIWWSIAGMPIVAPFALVPVIPNIPFFYLVFRAYSHWKAFTGSKHLEFLVSNNLVTPQPSQILNEIYTSGRYPFDPKAPTDEVEKMVLHVTDGKRIADALELPELDVEIDRAVWQVERALQAAKKVQDEKKNKRDQANEKMTKEEQKST